MGLDMWGEGGTILCSFGGAFRGTESVCSSASVGGEC